MPAQFLLQGGAAEAWFPLAAGNQGPQGVVIGLGDEPFRLLGMAQQQFKLSAPLVQVGSDLGWLPAERPDQAAAGVVLPQQLQAHPCGRQPCQCQQQPQPGSRPAPLPPLGLAPGQSNGHVIPAAGAGDLCQARRQRVGALQRDQFTAELQVIAIGAAGFAHAITAQHQGLQGWGSAERMQLHPLPPGFVVEGLAEAAGGFAAAGLLLLFAQQLGLAIGIHAGQVPVAKASTAPPLGCQ